MVGNESSLEIEEEGRGTEWTGSWSRIEGRVVLWARTQCVRCVCVRYAGSGGVKYELDAAQQGDCGRNAPPDNYQDTSLYYSVPLAAG